MEIIYYRRQSIRNYFQGLDIALKFIRNIWAIPDVLIILNLLYLSIKIFDSLLLSKDNFITLVSKSYNKLI